MEKKRENLEEDEYFTKARMTAIQGSTTFEELGKIALEVLKEMSQKAKTSIPPKKLVMVLGPMKSGGLESFDANVKRLTFAIQEIKKEGSLVFNQTENFQSAIEKTFSDKEKYPDGYEAKPLIEGFNKPILESGLIDKIYLLPNRTNSEGTRLEFEIVLKQDIPVEEITEDWLKSKNE